MSGNSAIDVAIALVLLYLVLSMIVTVLNEQFATAVDLRASTLESALSQLIDDNTLKADFWNHGLIAGLNAAVASEKANPVFRFLASICRTISGLGKDDGQPRVSYLSGRTFASALLASVDTTKTLATFDEVKSAIANMPDSNVRDALLSQLATANGDLEKLHENVSAWFDRSMERVSGVYKRYLKKISFVIGAVVVLVLNADTLYVANALWNDASLRAGMVEAASAAVAKGDPVKLSGDGDALQQIKQLEGTLRPLPLGWSKANLKSEVSPANFVLLVEKIVGLLLTAFAISLGAPFWFDLLGKFMRIRGTGEKPEKTTDTISH